jgi:diguanylate cyclase (GGDEF)-like protein
LRLKLLVIIALPAVVIISMGYFLLTQNMEANFDREYRERALLVAQTLQTSLPIGHLDNSQALQGYLRDLARAVPSIHHISIYSNQDGGIILASSEPSLVGLPAPPSDLEPLRTGKTILREEREVEPPLMEANVPLMEDGKVVASLGVYMSLYPRDALLRAQQTSFFLVGSAGLFLLLAIVYLATDRLLLSPISQVSRATSRIIQGDLNTKIPSLGQDELGYLADNVNRMMDELRREREALQQLATTDDLTELWNHRYFHERIREELSRAARLKEPLALVMFDLDHFKAFNDTHGHLRGDEALRRVGGIVRASVRPYDIPCRYGGEEFTVILPGVDAQGARSVSERIRQRIAAEGFDGVEGHTIPLTASFGIAAYPHDGGSPDELLQAADRALYASKRAGGNSITIYDRSLEAEPEEEALTLDRLFRKANLEALQLIARAVDAREVRSRGHSAGVTRYVRQLGVALGLARQELEMLETAALLHDLGKIGIPESILSKPGALTEKEWEVVRSHPIVGELMVKQVPALVKTLSAILYHHERWDGTGYPDGLKGEDIPLPARLLAIADAYEAMTSTRPYRRGLTKEQALAELRKGAGTQFDPQLVEVFIGILQDHTLTDEADQVTVA